ncbi:MAG: pyridoxamine 5'-phosphate oxidase family protein [Lachnospiraceae bacterium]|nr:pyridoxamine 5'-phosphate oxidase family protein [Lachnospiraceae bacterium]
MVRKDREVKDFKDMIAIVDKCNVLNLAMFDEDYPYVIPVSFGYEVIDEHLYLYIHGAVRGKKVDLLKKNNKVSFSMNQFYGYDETRTGITTRYESVTGTGTATPAENSKEKAHGLKLLCAHCGYQNYDVSLCKNIPFTNVWKIEVTSLYGKKNLRKVEI